MEQQKLNLELMNYSNVNNFKKKFKNEFTVIQKIGKGGFSQVFEVPV